MRTERTERRHRHKGVRKLASNGSTTPRSNPMTPYLLNVSTWDGNEQGECQVWVHSITFTKLASRRMFNENSMASSEPNNPQVC